MNLERQAAEESIRSLYAFIRNFWHVNTKDEFVDNWHIKELCSVLEEYAIDVVKGNAVKEDLIINVPPGTSKSTLVSQMFPLWLWFHKPDAIIITTSYSNDLSTKHSIKSKNIFNSDRYQKWFQSYFKNVWGKNIELTKNTEKQWINNFSGERYAASTGGTVTGNHAHIIIRDDPLNVTDGHSKATRDATNRFNDETLYNRKKDLKKTPTITVMQRIHEVDPTGHDLSQEIPIRHIKLPATDDYDILPPHYKAFYKDGLFDPIRMDREVLATMKKKLGTYGYAGQYMQSPFPEEGGKIKKDWFIKVDDGEVPKGIVWDMWIDGAYTDKAQNDPTGIGIIGRTRLTNKIYVKYTVSRHMEMPELLKEIKRIAKEHNLGRRSRVYIEPKASGHSIKQMLNSQTLLNCVLITGELVGQGKEARIQTASPRVESGRVYLIRGAWNEDFLSQVCFFPMAKHDEYVDILGYACEKYFDETKYEYFA